MKRTLCALLACALALSGLTGCGSIFDRRSSSVTTHQEQSASEEDASILRAETYAGPGELCAALCLHGSSPPAPSTSTNTPGTSSPTWKKACAEVRTEDPLGAYALNDIEYSYSRIISYYECTFNSPTAAACPTSPPSSAPTATGPSGI